MDALGWVGGLLAAAAMQFFNRKRSFPPELAMAVCAAIGIALYGVGHGLPARWIGDPLTAWLNPALGWALQVMGLRTALAKLPGMQTNSQP